MDAALSLADCIDPTLVANPAPPPGNMPVPKLALPNGSPNNQIGEWSQPKLQQMIESGAIPPEHVDHRPHHERIADWLLPAERLGAVKLSRW
jgi:hypothetical protein